MIFPEELKGDFYPLAKSKSNKRVFRSPLYALLTILSVVALSSCKKDDNVEKEKVSTYTFKYNADNTTGVTVDVIIFEYNDIGEIVGQQSFDNCVKGFKRDFTANSRSTKVKVRLTMSVGSSSIVRWISQVFYLDIGKNIIIETNNNTIVGAKEP